VQEKIFCLVALLEARMAEEIQDVAAGNGIVTLGVGRVAPVGAVQLELRLNGHNRFRAEVRPADSVVAV